MARIRIRPPDLLPDLYQGATSPERWPRFLSGLAQLFNANTVALRVVDVAAPVIHRSFTVGFDEAVLRRYVERYVTVDPFRDYLASRPVGVAGVSHEVLSDSDYARSEHYHEVFRPNGNFYAMGAHVERNGRRALQIGVHRARRQGRFESRECRALEFFSPHLREAGRLMRVLGQFECAMRQSQAALDRLPQGVWMLRGNLVCRWMNEAADEAIRIGAFGLCLRGERLCITGPGNDNRLRAALRSLRRCGAGSRTVPLGVSGAVLVLVADTGAEYSWNLDCEGGVLVFLLDPDCPARVEPAVLQRRYGLSPAECRLTAEFLRGLDLGAASTRLNISVHTARAQLKAIMRKTGTSRQPELMRELLLGVAALREAPSGE